MRWLWWPFRRYRALERRLGHVELTLNHLIWSQESMAANLDRIRAALTALDAKVDAIAIPAPGISDEDLGPDADKAEAVVAKVDAKFPPA